MKKLFNEDLTKKYDDLIAEIIMKYDEIGDEITNSVISEMSLKDIDLLMHKIKFVSELTSDNIEELNEKLTSI